MTKISHISWGVTTKGGYDKGFYGMGKILRNEKDTGAFDSLDKHENIWWKHN